MVTVLLSWSFVYWIKVFARSQRGEEGEPQLGPCSSIDLFDKCDGTPSLERGNGAPTCQEVIPGPKNF